MVQKLYIFPDVIFRRVGTDFLAYTALTGETIVLSQFAYATLAYLSLEARDYSALLERLKQEILGDIDIDLESTLQNTVNELFSRGFLYLQ